MSELLDDLARTLAQPMPRRRALGVLGVTLVGLATGGTATCARGPLVGTQSRGCGSAYKVCEPATQACFAHCCPKHTACSFSQRGKTGCQISPGCCDPCNSQRSTPDGQGGCKPGPVADTCCKKKCGKSKCCVEGEKCCTGKGRATCCPEKQDCVNGRCGCKSGKKCGETCCAESQTCCGGKCCSKTQKCCDDHCCGEKQTCCVKGCCPEGTRCYKDAGTFRCCPEERLASTPAGKVCCPPYYYVQWGNTCCRTGRTCTECDPACPRGHYCQDGYCLQG